MTRPYTERAVPSPSLARTHRIFELQVRIRAMMEARPDFIQQLQENSAINHRAMLVRRLHEQDRLIAKSKSEASRERLKREKQETEDKLYDLDSRVPPYEPESTYATC